MAARLMRWWACAAEGRGAAAGQAHGAAAGGLPAQAGAGPSVGPRAGRWGARCASGRQRRLPAVQALHSSRLACARHEAVRMVGRGACVGACAGLPCAVCQDPAAGRDEPHWPCALQPEAWGGKVARACASREADGGWCGMWPCLRRAAKAPAAVWKQGAGGHGWLERSPAGCEPGAPPPGLRLSTSGAGCAV